MGVGVGDRPELPDPSARHGGARRDERAHAPISAFETPTALPPAAQRAAESLGPIARVMDAMYAASIPCVAFKGVAPPAPPISLILLKSLNSPNIPGWRTRRRAAER